MLFEGQAVEGFGWHDGGVGGGTVCGVVWYGFIEAMEQWEVSEFDLSPIIYLILVIMDWLEYFEVLSSTLLYKPHVGAV